MTTPLPAIYAFETTLHAAPPESLSAGPPLTDRWGEWATLALLPGELTTPLPVGFDEALERLGRLPRCYGRAAARQLNWTSYWPVLDRREHHSRFSWCGRRSSSLMRCFASMPWPVAKPATVTACGPRKPAAGDVLDRVRVRTSRDQTIQEM